MRINSPDGILVVSRSTVGALQYAPALMAAPVAIMAAIAVPNFLEAQVRSKVSRVRADMRSMATAIESYYIDTNAYPAWSNDPSRNAFGELAKTDPSLASEPTFMMKKSISDPLMTLTTPVMYITGYMRDPFTKAKGATFSYWATKNGWILWSPGPDGKYSLSLENIAKAYDPAAQNPSPALIGMTFDPTNGTTSMGDIWRIKQ
jgi:type II secretory pathway pseudopilin PulG